jgi:hypothetical protein
MSPRFVALRQHKGCSPVSVSAGRIMACRFWRRQSQIGDVGRLGQ